MEIIVNNATKCIKKAPILDNVSLELQSGMIYGLQGPNGSGKTMLMRLISGLIRPTSGKVYIDGRELGKEMYFPVSVGMLIETPAFLSNYTGLQNLELLAQIQNRISSRDIRLVLASVGLDPDDKRKYRKYSLGMKQRLGLAAAIMEKPDLLFLDEPTNALDGDGIALVCDLILREKARGALIVIACHDPVILERLSDEVYTIAEGRITKKVFP